MHGNVLTPVSEPRFTGNPGHRLLKFACPRYLIALPLLGIFSLYIYTINMQRLQLVAAVAVCSCLAGLANAATFETAKASFEQCGRVSKFQEVLKRSARHANVVGVTARPCPLGLQRPLHCVISRPM